MPDTRYPKILAMEAIKRKAYWYKELCNINNEHGAIVNVNYDNFANWKSELSILRAQISNKHNVQCITRAQNSQFTVIYKKLNYNLDSNVAYVNDNFKTDNISWIIKLRGDLINLNYKRYNNDLTAQLCTLCDMIEVENVMHFIARCPAYKEIRVKHLKKNCISEDDLITYLNGNCWDVLLKYCKAAWYFRSVKIANS